MQHVIDLAITLGGAGLVAALAFMKLKALGVIDLDRPRAQPLKTCTRWLFWTYERRDLVEQGDGSAAPGYFGVVPVDVIADTYAEALEKARVRRPPTSDGFGYELKHVTDFSMS